MKNNHASKTKLSFNRRESKTGSPNDLSMKSSFNHSLPMLGSNKKGYEKMIRQFVNENRKLDFWVS